MVEKEGIDSEKDAMKAYRAAREEKGNVTNETEGDEVSSVSSALIDKVICYKFKGPSGNSWSM